MTETIDQEQPHTVTSSTILEDAIIKERLEGNASFDMRRHLFASMMATVKD
jgi:hypothetical protein